MDFLSAILPDGRHLAVPLGGATTAPAIGLAPGARVLVDAGPDRGSEYETTWGAFVDDNRDGFDAFELSLIGSTLQVAGFYRGGGGAEGEWTVRVAP